MFKDLFTQNTDFSMVLANYLRPIVMYGAESRLNNATKKDPRIKSYGLVGGSSQFLRAFEGH